MTDQAPDATVEALRTRTEEQERLLDAIRAYGDARADVAYGRATRKAIDRTWDQMLAAARIVALAAHEVADSRPDSIDAAWAAVEAVLPKGVELFVSSDVVDTPPEHRWSAEASARVLTEGRTAADWTFSANFQCHIAYGPTPAAALRALEARLAAHPAEAEESP